MALPAIALFIAAIFFAVKKKNECWKWFAAGVAVQYITTLINTGKDELAGLISGTKADAVTALTGEQWTTCTVVIVLAGIIMLLCRYPRYEASQTLIASLLCVLGGLVIGYIVLLVIEPSGAFEAIQTILENFLTYSKPKSQMKYLGQTLVRTAPLLMCALSVLFAYKVGMFNIGAAGQYVAGACAALFFGLYFKAPWWVCVLAAMAAGAFLGVISGALKTFCNVNVVISGIMLNWITLYITNMVLSMDGVKNPMSPYTIQLRGVNPNGLLPQMDLHTLFGNEKSVTIAIPLAVIMAIVVWVVLNKTKFGYELKATGYNFHAAKYSGMKEKRNIILTMAISGALAGMGAALLYLTGIEEWETTISSVPGMGFNGIAVAFLGGLSPIGSILSAFFIQHITLGGSYVDTTYYCAQISSLISSLIIFLCAFVGFIRFAMQNRIRKRDEAMAMRKDMAAKGGSDT